MSDIETCPICFIRFWPKDGHTCRYGRHGDVSPKFGTYQGPSLTADDVRKIVREELERAGMGKEGVRE